MTLFLFTELQPIFKEISLKFQISGTELYLDTVKERLQTECVSELRFNVSLWSTNTSSDSNIAEMVFSHDCPNDCSSAGQCLNGNFDS